MGVVGPGRRGAELAGGKIGGWSVCHESKKICLRDIHMNTGDFNSYILGDSIIFNCLLQTDGQTD